MAIQWLEEIKRAEADADAVREDAVAQGRQIIKSVEEASLANERQAFADLRAEYQARMAQIRTALEQEIAAKSGQKQTALDALSMEAHKRIPDAARIIAERIVQHGDC